MNTDTIRQRIVELVPELSVNTRVRCDTCREPGMACNECGGGLIEVIGRPITLADVLRAIGGSVEHDSAYEYTVDSRGDFDVRDRRTGMITTPCTWDLLVDFDGQTNEVKEFIGKLLGV